MTLPQPLTLSIDRSSLSLGALVIGNDYTAARWVDVTGNGRPQMTWRRTYAQGGPFINGDLLTAASKSQSTLPLAWYVQASSTSALKTLQQEDEAALSQFSYTVTTTENGVTTTWTCDPADLSWGDFVPAMSAVFMVRAAVTIPVYPVSS